MHLKLHGKCTADDYIAAQRVHYTLKRRLIGLAIIVGTAEITGLLFYFLEDNRNSWVPISIACIAPVFGYFFIWYMMPASIARKTRKIYQQQKTLHYSFVWELTDESYSVTSEASQARLPWTDFHKWNADKDIILLYTSDLIFLMLPCRLFTSDADFQTLKDFLQKTLGKAGGASKNR